MSTADTIRAFLRLLRQRGYYVRIRDIDQWQRFSREVSDEELVAKWEEEEGKKEAPRG